MTIGNDYILYDDRGLKVDFYLDLLDDFENIGVMFSGGVDSAFAFYWLAKCIHENKLDNTILLMTGWELETDYLPIDEVRKIVEIVEDEFPNSNIVDHYFYEYPVTIGGEITKEEVEDKFKYRFVESGLIDHYINGTTAGPIFEDIYLGDVITLNRDKNRRQKALKERRGPFQQVDKKFIAYQYKKYNLMDTIYPLTFSCTWLSKIKGPCKKCWWCKERYWAFGSYDEGIQGEPPILGTKQEAYDIILNSGRGKHKQLMELIQENDKKF